MSHGILLSKLHNRDLPAPEQEIVKYDLVFASGRSAIEALCTGCAVIVCDSYGLGGMVTSENYPHFRTRNFALRTLTKPVRTEELSAEIRRYDRDDAIRVTERIRCDADLETYLDSLEMIYAEAIARCQTTPPDAESMRRAQQLFLHDALPRRPGDPRWPWLADRARIADLDPFELSVEFEKLRTEAERLSSELERRTIEAAQFKSTLMALQQTISWRLTKPLRAIRAVWRKP